LRLSVQVQSCWRLGRGNETREALINRKKFWDAKVAERCNFKDGLGLW